jgi:predicted helicase
MSDPAKRKARIFYARVDEFWRKEEKYAYLDAQQHRGNVVWREIQPDAKQNWLTEGMRDEFEGFIPVGTKEGKDGAQTNETVFKIFSGGVKTNRDAWVYNFDKEALVRNVERTIEAYNEEVYRWSTSRSSLKDLDAFMTTDSSRVSWSETLKNHLVGGHSLDFELANVRAALYRPFVKRHLYFEQHLNERRYLIPSIFPNRETEIENLAVLIKVGSEWPAFALMVNVIPDLLPQGGSQCFPFYTYKEDGTNRHDNITEWALEQFREHYADKTITKWDIFHYVYALLHHPLYRERYAVNLKRELPRVPFASDFRDFAEIGKRLAELHVDYEQQPEYPLEKIETPGVPLDWRVEKMKLSKDKRSLIYNDFLTLSGIPPEVFEYRLGNRSALDWIVDQYQVSTDKRSGITNDPNRVDDPEYIVRLIGQVITVSLETVKLVSSLATLPILGDIDV